MSMKSFDKLCRDILIGDPYAEREIFDERQKLFRLKLSVEALLIFGGLVTANCILMEFFRKWGETEIFTILLIATFCVVYWVIRCAAKGCLIGTNGKRLTRNCGFGTVMWFVIDLIEPIEALVRGDREFFIVNGALPTNCCSLSARCCSPSAESLCCGAFIGKMSGTGGKRNEYEIFR